MGFMSSYSLNCLTVCPELLIFWNSPTIEERKSLLHRYEQIKLGMSSKTALEITAFPEVGRGPCCELPRYTFAPCR